MFPKSMLCTILLALSVAANPIVIDKGPITLGLTRKLNLTSVHNLVRHDQARAQRLRNVDGARNGAIINEQVDNQAVTYIASVSVGSPATTYELLIDTGSSNTWIGATQPYVKTSTSSETQDRVSVSYGSGSFSGDEYIDQVSFGPGLTIPRQSIGVASQSSGFDGIDGILGIGPVDLTEGTLSPDSRQLIPTVTDNLYTTGVINSNTIGISYEPTTQPEVLNGELTWGGVDNTKYTGSITYAPITGTFPASYYWGINQSIKYGTNTILSNKAGIVDTGTTLILLATDAYNHYVSATGATLDSSTGLLKITPAQYAQLKSLLFVIGGTSFELTPNAQIWPRSLNTYIGGSASSVYLVVSDLGSYSGEGLDFINGYTFLERFYSVYDTGNRRVGIANTPYTRATTN